MYECSVKQSVYAITIHKILEIDFVGGNRSLRIYFSSITVKKYGLLFKLMSPLMD